MWKLLSEQHAEVLEKTYANLSLEIRSKLEKDLPRKEIVQKIDVSYDFSFTNLQKKAEEFAKTWKKTITDVNIEHSYYENYDNYSSEIHLEIQGLETDSQYHKRLLEYRDANEKREKWERKEFERLKTKFSD